ncbi:CHAD domain-containing protein, partial [Verminephrobacter aporrectodeae]|uniref:CHAD domain-containing protein n=1 Tax=Verminephrobacter aporrectodeae TaxID=1110389 RepID=UPI000237694C
SGPEAMSARPVALPSGLSLRAIARQVLGEAFLQFSTNLHALQQARAPDAPELLHQARVGWRRFRSLHRLLRPGLPALPPWAPLGPLLAALGALRDLDVARLDTLPPLAQDFVADAAQRRRAWQDLQAALEQAAQQALEAVHQALQAPAVGQVLLAWVEWLETLAQRLVVHAGHV